MEGAYFSANGLFGVVAPNGKFTKACARVGRRDLQNTNNRRQVQNPQAETQQSLDERLRVSSTPLSFISVVIKFQENSAAAQQMCPWFQRNICINMGKNPQTDQSQNCIKYSKLQTQNQRKNLSGNVSTGMVFRPTL